MKLDEILSGSAGQAGILWVVRGNDNRRLIRGLLGDLLTDGSAPGRLRLTRVKYKPGRKLSAYFTVPFIRTQDAFPARPIAVSWKTGDPDPAAPAAQAAEVEVEIQARGLSQSFRRLWQVFPGQNARLAVWPYDPAFPQLPHLSDRNYIAGLEGLQEEPPEGGGWQVTPIRYRPGERHVLRYAALKTPGGEPRRVYAKLYRQPQAAGRAARITARAVAWLAQSAQGVGGIPPLGWSEAEGYVLYPHAPGTPVSHLLGRLTPGLLGQLEQAGAALRALHEGPAELMNELEEHPLGQEIQAVRRASEHIQALLPQAGASLDELLDWTGRLASRLPAETPAFTHSDFKADHLLVSPLGVTIIDFDTCARADPAIDPGKFLADLVWWFTLNGWEGLEQAQAAFLRGYGRDAPAERLVRARLYQALVLIKITARRAKLSDEDWATQVTRMIGMAGATLRAVALEMGEPVV